MPVFVYRCTECGWMHDCIEPRDAPNNHPCTECGSLMKRNFSSVSIGRVPGGARSALADYVGATANVESIDVQREINRAKKEGRDPDFTGLHATKTDIETAKRYS